MDELRYAYYDRLAAAYVRGRLAGPGAEGAPLAAELCDPPLDALGAGELASIIAAGLERGLRLHRFKRTATLPRVARVLGILKGIAPAELLDIGSGRGAFLWPLLDAFPALPVTALDLLEHRVADIQAVRDGGAHTLVTRRADATALPFDDASFDVVTMLEVLEHIPDAGRALAEVCRVARRFVILSVPSKPDNNPEHLHLFGHRELEGLLAARGAASVKISHVPNHMIAVARVSAAP